VPIEIKFPIKDGTAADPVRVPKQFIAFGKKDPGQVPAGFMVSIDPATHKPDGKFVIGGFSVPYKKKGKDTLVEDPTKWAIYFRMAGTSHKQQFRLLVFDVGTFPPMCMPVQVTPSCRDHLAVLKNRVGKGKNDSEASGRYINPASGTQMPRDQFVAYGDLPPGDYDILIDPMDMNATQLVKSDDNTRVCGPYWSWSDSSGFWAAFFPEINPAITKVDVQVVFKPSNDEDGTTGIELTNP
jgi:hypothetical protein